MRTRLLLLSLGFILWASAAHAQTAPPANHDFRGIWGVKQMRNPPWAPDTNRSYVAGDIKMQQWALEHCRRVGCARGVRFTNLAGGNAYLIGEDPALKYCAPYGYPRIMVNGGAMEIFQTEDRVFMRFYRNNEMRQIWVDGRKHPDELDLTWLGDSVGHWDGDTLLVDTIHLYGGENGKYKWLDEAGFPHTSQLHVTERIRRTNRNTMVIDFTLEDPGAFAGTIRNTVTYELNPTSEGNDNGTIHEYIRCEDRIFAEGEGESWPFFSGADYPLPDVPPVGPEWK